MLLSSLPPKFPIPFANSAGQSFTRPIPTPSQQGITQGAASLTDGFPPICFIPTTSNGVPPAGQDINGILNQITAWNRWQAAGNPVNFDQAFCTAINGYPLNAVLASTTAGVLWLNTVDGNTTNPDGSSAAGWVPLSSASGASTGHGRVNLQFVGSSSLKLAPRNGNGLSIGGTLVSIPGTGLTFGATGVYVGGATNQNLAPSTAYLVSLAVISGSLVPRFWALSAYGHMPDTTAGNIGVEVISQGGNPITTDTLIGMVYTNAGPGFSDNDGARWVLSWFNRTAKASRTYFTTTRSTASSNYVELNPEIRNSFLTWSGAPVVFGINGYANISFNANQAASAGASIGFDSATPENETTAVSSYVGSATVLGFNCSFSARKTGLSEGLHYSTVLGYVSSAPSVSFAYNSPNNTQNLIVVEG